MTRPILPVGCQRLSPMPQVRPGVVLVGFVEYSRVAICPCTLPLQPFHPGFLPLWVGLSLFQRPCHCLQLLVFCNCIRKLDF